jgi:hypothetical protein
MSVIPKKKKDPESGLLTSSKPFVFNNMVERVGSNLLENVVSTT